MIALFACSQAGLRIFPCFEKKLCLCESTMENYTVDSAEVFNSRDNRMDELYQRLSKIAKFH